MTNDLSFTWYALLRSVTFQDFQPRLNTSSIYVGSLTLCMYEVVARSKTSLSHSRVISSKGFETEMEKEKISAPMCRVISSSQDLYKIKDTTRAFHRSQWGFFTHFLFELQKTRT